MKYFRNPTSREVFAYEEDGSQDDFIDPSLVPMSGEEVAEHLKPKVDYVAQENTWRGLEMTLIADQLLRIEDGDQTALPGTDRQWRDYRIKLRDWAEGSEYFPDEAHRPQRPVAS